MAADLVSKIAQARRQQNNIFKVLKEKKINPKSSTQENYLSNRNMINKFKVIPIKILADFKQIQINKLILKFI